MDHFESGKAVQALAELQRVVEDDKFGRRSTALKRAITMVDREPDLARWGRWVHKAAIDAELPVQLSREQLLAFLRISGDFPAALEATIRDQIAQAFSQPKAILLQVLDGLRAHQSGDVRALSSDGIRQISELADPVLNLSMQHLAKSS